REQFGFALNRLGRSDEAEKVLKDVIVEFGPSSETNGILGRVYKDRWEAEQSGSVRKRAYLKRAIDCYLSGFEADWRDAYPGVNAATLMEISEEADRKRHSTKYGNILVVVRYAASQQAKRQSDYWSHATLLEINILERRQEDAMD